MAWSSKEGIQLGTVFECVLPSIQKLGWRMGVGLSLDGLPQNLNQKPTRMRIFFFLTFILWAAACNSSTPELPIPSDMEGKAPKTKDTLATSQTTDTPEDAPIPMPPFWKSKPDVDTSELAVLRRFVPKGQRIMDWEYGDLNRDAKTQDVLLVTHDAMAEAKDEEGRRTVHILTRGENGQLEPRGSNAHAVLCAGCGGVMGDPYSGIAIKNGYFSLEHYGGSNWRWTQIITFKYDEAKKDWLLHKKGGVSYHTSNPNEIEETVQTSKDFGTVRFADYVDED